MKRIAILGAGGFVGRSLTDYLGKKPDRYEVFPVTHRQLSLLEGDAVAAFLESRKPDVLIHCANEGGARKNGYAEATDIVGNNLRMFFHLERCLTPEMKLIHFGSGAQYNKQRDLVKVRESAIGEQIPQDAYGFSKLVLSNCIAARPQKRILNPIIFGLFGPFEDYSFKFISNACIKNMLGLPITINQDVRFDYLYIDDFFRIMEHLIEAEELPHREFNLTPTVSVTLTEIADIINRVGKNRSEVTVLHPGLNFEYTGDNTRLLENMGGRFSFLDYEESIARLYAYYLHNIDSLDTDAVRRDTALQFCRIKEQQKG